MATLKRPPEAAPVEHDWGGHVTHLEASATAANRWRGDLQPGCSLCASEGDRWPGDMCCASTPVSAALLGLVGDHGPVHMMRGRPVPACPLCLQYGATPSGFIRLTSKNSEN